jgi:hypothetical protein
VPGKIAIELARAQQRAIGQMNALVSRLGQRIDDNRNRSNND